MYRFGISFLVFSVLLPSFGTEARHLVRQGKAAAEIVVGADAPAPERFAAEELSKWVGKITGTTLAVVTEPTAAKGLMRVYIGGDSKTRYPDDVAALSGSDGFAVRRDGKDVRIFGVRPRGTLYGVYAFLEANSDIVWTRGQERFTVFTPTDSFVAEKTDWRERPVFDLRGWWITSTHYDPGTEYWDARMRCNFGPSNIKVRGVYERMIQCGFMVDPGGGHNIHLFMPDGLFETHPEYFALYNGKRQRDTRKHQLCFSNLDAARVVGEQAALAISKSKYRPDHYSIKTEDNQRLCSCENCLKPISLADGTTLGPKDSGFRTTQYYIFLNEALKKVGEVHPGLRINSYGYQFTSPAPSVKVDDSVNVLFCPYPKNDKYSILAEENRTWKERVDGWAEKGTKNLVWREYYGCASGFPRPLPEVAAVDMRYIHDRLGVSRIFAERPPDCDERGFSLGRIWDVSAVEFWVLSRLYWNPYADPGKLRDEYIRRAYRSAAPGVRRFYAIIRESWYSDPRQSLFSDKPDKTAIRYIKRKGLEDKCRAALVEAATAAEKDLPQVKELVSRLRGRFEQWMSVKTVVGEPFRVRRVADASRCIRPDADIWKKADSTSEFKRIGSGKLTDSTRVKALHDYRNLYVLFDCADGSMATQVADPESKREIWPGGEHVELFFTGGFLNDRYYHLVCDVNGNMYDGIGRDRTYNLRPGWSASVTKGKKGYFVVFVVSLDAFKVDFMRTNRFGALFYRWSQHKDRDVEESSWQSIGVQRPMDFGEMVFDLEMY